VVGIRLRGFESDVAFHRRGGLFEISTESVCIAELVDGSGILRSQSNRTFQYDYRPGVALLIYQQPSGKKGEPSIVWISTEQIIHRRDCRHIVVFLYSR